MARTNVSRILPQPRLVAAPENKRAKTKRILGGRLDMTLKNLENLAVIGENAHNYDIRDSDVEKLEQALTASTNYVVETLRHRGRARRVVFDD